MAITHLPDVADAARLTAVLRKAGVLDAGRVRNVVEIAPPTRKLRSHTFRLRMDYEGPASNAPSTLILKIGHLDETGRPIYDNAREIAFYRDVAPESQPSLVPRCYEVANATEGAVWHLLLEDLTETHFIATQWPIPPAIEQCEQIVRALARIHAGCWDHPQLGVTLGRWYDEAFWERHLQDFAVTLERFTDRFGDVLPPERRNLYTRLLDRAPKLLARYHRRRDLTIAHGDAHFWNFFLPKLGTSDDVRLLDWEGWAINTASTDLAYMLAMLWYPDRRKRFERRLLDHYYAALLANGVSGYGQNSLDDDYRLSALWLIARPVWQAMAGIGGGVWWNNLERIFLAVDDLGSRELLD